jgi:hypothetical protein
LQNVSNKKETTLVDEIFVEIKAFEELCSTLRDYGARDTEPDGIFQWLIDAAAKGKKPSVPRDGRGWDLYTQSMDCSPAADKMHDQALKVVRLIEQCPVRDVESLRERIESYCWRIY